MSLIETETEPATGPGSKSLERQRLVVLIKEITMRDIVPAIIFRERLESDLLEAVGLINDQKSYDRRQIRTRTMNLYKQQKFNLLREESEGYSKLLTELTASLPPPPQNGWAIDDVYKQQLASAVGATLNNVKSLIGYFDLDPNRAFDVILDCFIANVSDHWRFFLELIEASPWTKLVKTKGLDGEEVETRVGLPLCAQVLGFKFTAYFSPDFVGQTPVSLFHVAALLIRHKIITLNDIWPHLGPDDDEISGEYEAYLAKVAERCKSAGQMKGLELAGILADDDSTPYKPSMRSVERTGSSMSVDGAAPSTVTEAGAEKEEPPKPRKLNQKAGLANALVVMGDQVNARLILQRLPNLIHMYPEIAEGFCRLLHVILEPLVSSLRVKKPPPTLPAQSTVVSIHPPNLRKLPSKEELNPNPTLILNPKYCDLNDKVYIGKRLHPPKYRFAYDLWKDKLPRASGFSDALRIIRTLLQNVGPYLHRDMLLFSKLVRIGAAHVRQADIQEKEKNVWLNIIAQSFFPALSQTKANPGLATELWQLVSCWPYETRFALYGEWRHRTYENYPELRVARAGCLKDIKWIMKRLAKETIKAQGRQIGKIAHSNPTITFQIVIEQLQSYDNQIPFVVDSSRYLTELDFDVLTFSLLEALATDKPRMQDNGKTVSKWLTNLATFIGQMCKKHPLELRAILEYMCNRLLTNETADLVILNKLIAQMSGVRPTEDSTVSQLEAMSGGETLKREVLMYESQRTTRKGSSKLMKALMESQTIGPLALLIAQQKREILSRMRMDEDIKVAGWFIDHCQNSFMQYVDFLASNLDKGQYYPIFENPEVICLRFGLDPEVAFHLLRPKLTGLVMGLHDGGPSQPANVEGSSTEDVTNKMDVDAAEIAGDNDMHLDIATRLEQDLARPNSWHPKLYDTMRSVLSIVPEKVWSGLSPQFYTTFWQLSLYDIFIPSAHYASEQAKQRLIIEQIERSENAPGGAPLSKLLKDKERAKLMRNQLAQEAELQEAHVKRVMVRLSMEKNTWFPEYTAKHVARPVFLIQYCLVPRLLFSESDAIYTARLIHHMHKLNVPNINIAKLYDDASIGWTVEPTESMPTCACARVQVQA
ncbi:transcription factor/nuclear export subunit protein 2-domain-containing protein [Polychytrium aggregatum]|uniref:transcription factor/nuclear export subunit protein 2-domain-containing protein n=1 Tax=Polychytrium aggregatum TaxID=110093 RepID=UPI0022FF305A|nr:transcription factor/nuclear export subunit protein 2-domain-containing protein [Polychytrium aggregatum]KAI9207980.1 transcription factor/nuclear export subunit protein 2-domain-containing protein [Polychytrium aggregatum]